MRKKTAVLVLIDTFVGQGGGGAERHLQLLLEALPREEFDLTCIEFLANENRPICVVPGVRIERWPMASLASLQGIRTLFRLRHLCRSRNVRVILSFFEKSDILATVLGATLGSLRLVSSRRDTGFRYSPTTQRIYQRINRRFEAFVSPSAAVHESLRRYGVPSHRIAIIRNAVAEPLQADLPSRRDLRKELSLRDDDFVVVCVGSLKPVKNQGLLLQAFAQLSGEGPTPVLVLVGNGSDGENLKRLSRELGIADRVKFPGHLLKGVDRWLSAADVFALTSTTEGLSNALLEAQAAGLPAVVTNVGGNPEVVVDQVTGYLVEVTDVDLLAERLDRLRKDPELRKSMGESAVRRVRTAFSYRAMIAGYRNVLSS